MTDLSSRTLRPPPWLLVALVVAVFEGFLVLRPGSDRLIGVLDNLALAAGGATASAACWRRWRRERGATGRGWQCLAVATGVFGLSEVGWAALFLPWSAVPVPGATFLDLLVVPVFPLQVCALILIAGLATRRGRAISVLDSLLLGLSFLFLSWVLVVGPAYRDSVLSGVSEVTLLYFMIGALAVTSLALALATVWCGEGTTLWLLVGAFAWLGVTQVAFGEVAIRGHYRTGHVLIDVGWFAPLLVVALAASRPVVRRVDERRPGWLLTLGLPYGAGLLAALTVVVLLLARQPFDLLMRATLVGITGLLLVRQLLTLLENRSLTSDLERRVEERSRAAVRSELRLASILRNSPDVIALADPDGVLTYLSPSAAVVLGVTTEQVLGRSLLDLVHPGDRTSTERMLSTCVLLREQVTLSSRLQDDGGAWRPVEATVSLMEEDGSAQLVLNIRDVSERVALQEELRHQAFHDALTGLPNRALFHERLRHALARANRSGEEVSVLYLDLDHFKRVNDTEGHAAGDAVLVAVGERLLGCLRPSDTAARLGGDEFAVLLEGTTEVMAAEVAARVVAALEAPLSVGGRPHVVSASIGVRTCRGGVDSDVVLVRDADVAMYEAKAAGRAQATPFQQHMHERLVRENALERGLRAALEAEELQVFYQPVVDLRSHTVAGVEALVRWHHGSAGWVPPSLFVPLAEQRGLIGAIDGWVLRESCRRVAELARDAPSLPPLRVSVNVSATELHDPGLPERVADALSCTGLQPGLLTLEVTETAVLSDPPAAAALLSRLRELGVRISLDDFGTGYSSLSTLRSIPLDEIKIDRSFVERIDCMPANRQVVQFLVALAQSMGLHTVAEAIETPDQLQHLTALACDAGQGYLFSPPVTAAELATRLNSVAPVLR